MSTVFIGGSRRLGRLNDVVRARLEKIVERGHRVLIGDANGGDRAVQTFLAEHGHKEVIVYCMDGICRNNVGGWPVRAVEGGGKRGFDYYSRKDVELAHDADCGFMLWDAKSKGTLLNMTRLIDLGRPVEVYYSPDRTCRTLRTKAELVDLVSSCPQQDRQRLGKLLGAASEQITLFPAKASS